MPPNKETLFSLGLDLLLLRSSIRCIRQKTKSSAPMPMRVHHELSSPSKAIRGLNHAEDQDTDERAGEITHAPVKQRTADHGRRDRIELHPSACSP